MSSKVKSRPLVKTGGASAFIQEAEKARKIPYVGFSEGKCHRRVILMSKVEKQRDENTGDDVEVTVPGLAVLHMMSDFMGVDIKNPGYSDSGMELKADYTREMYTTIVSDILSFDEEKYEPIGSENLLKAYSNLIKYIEEFSLKFDPSKNTDRQNIVVLRGVIFKYNSEMDETEKQRNIIKHFKSRWGEEVGGQGKYSDLFFMAFMQAVREWIEANTSLKIAYTPTANANFTGVPYYGALADPTTEEGKHQEAVIHSLASVARVISQRNFEETSDSADGLTRGTKAYNEAYNDWVNVPRQNRQLIQRPSLNGVIFIYDVQCDEKCKNHVTDERGNDKLRQAIHGVSPNKIEKIKKVFVYDTVLENPDFIDVVFKYTTGSTKALMGQQMSVERWEGAESTRLDFDEIKRYIEQTDSPNIAERINSYQPFPFEDFVQAFRKYLERMNSRKQLDFIKEDETLKGICSRGFEYIGFDLDSTSISVEDILSGKGQESSSMAGMAANLGINFAGGDDKSNPTPQPTPQPEVQVQLMPQPEVQVQSVPQPEVPVQPQVQPTANQVETPVVTAPQVNVPQ